MCGVVLLRFVFADHIFLFPHPRLFSRDVIAAHACYNISSSLERTGALPRALEAAREAMRIWQATLPPGHKDISDAEELVRRLEEATR